MTFNRAFSRRIFIGTTAAALAAPVVRAQGRPRVVIVGGGAGGATAAHHLIRDSAGGLDVILIEPNQTYSSAFYSNHCIGGLVDFDRLSHGYARLAALGVTLVQDSATGIDRDAQTVALADGGQVAYDKLILSPGIDYIEGAVEGWDLSAAEAMPHAYKGGSQTDLLRRQLMAMPEGGTFAIVAPPNPFRCPPGPYERASLVALYLKQHNPTAKILIADPKPIFSKMDLFQLGWAKYYPGMIDWIGEDFGGGSVAVDPAAMVLTLDGEEIAVDVCNVIPAMKAGAIAEAAALTESGWVPVHPATMQSHADAKIHVLGDACHQGDMPKSAFAANSQARICAAAIRAELLGTAPLAPEFFNTCFSLLAADDGIKVGARYEAVGEKIAMQEGFLSGVSESAEERAATAAEAEAWYTEITADMFG